jgi:hypothetical protein
MLRPLIAKLFGKNAELSFFEIETTVYLENGEIQIERRAIPEL